MITGLQTKASQDQLHRCEAIARKIGDTESELRNLESQINALKRVVSAASRAHERAREGARDAAIDAATDAATSLVPAIGVVKAAFKAVKVLKKLGKGSNALAAGLTILPAVNDIRRATSLLEEASRNKEEFRRAFAEARTLRRQAESVSAKLQQLENQYRFNGCAGI